MECWQPIPVQKDELVVHHWKDGSSTKITLPIRVYPDESVVQVLTKIAHFLKQKTLPYAWHTRPLLFTPTGAWEGYHYNPFKASLPDAAAATPPTPTLTYTFQALMPTGTIHITFPEDVPASLRESPYYFPDLKLHMRSNASIQKEDALLSSLWASADTGAEFRNCTYTRVVYEGTLKKQPILSDLFDQLHANKHIPFLRWVDDRSRILYKVYDQHSIPEDTITSWMRVPHGDGGVIILHAGKGRLYNKCVIHANGIIQVSYHIDAREQMDIEPIRKQHTQFMQHLSSILKTNVKTRIAKVSLRTSLVKHDPITLSGMAGVLLKLFPIFLMVKLLPNSLELMYKRSSNHVAFDVTQYIRSLLTFSNPTEKEIIQDLVVLHGFSAADATAYYQQAKQVETIATNKQMEASMLLRVSTNPVGFDITVENCPSMEEARIALHWLRSCMMATPIPKQQKPNKVIPKAKTPTPPASSASSSATPSATSSASSAASASSTASEKSLSSSLSVGGAIGKEYEGYFLKMLQEADADLFLKTKDYARSCMVTNFRQPVILTKKEKEALDKTEFAAGIDNFYEYGSDPNNKNVLFCPRIWCPKSKVPMTPEQYKQHDQKCPKGEDPILLYNDGYWGNDPNVVHHVGFLSKRSESGLCLPCCMKRAQKDIQTKLKDCEPRGANASASAMAPAAAAPSAAPEEKAKEEYYLISQPAPLAEGRYGVVPKPLHDALFPDISHSLCNKTLTSQECLVRRGIHHGDDSFLAAIASALGLPDKKRLIQWMAKKLDPITFLGLENGHLLTLFMRPEPIRPSEEKSLLKRWRTWIQPYDKYVKLFQLSDLTDRWRLSRELAIFDAYERFFAYLRSSEVKNPYLFHDILRNLGILLLLWEKLDNDTAFLYCPHYVNMDEVMDSLAASQKAVLLLKEGSVYEPLELKVRNKKEIETVPFTRAKAMIDMLHACGDPADGPSRVLTSNLIAFGMWVEVSLHIPEHFRIQKLVLGASMKITHCITKSGLVIKLPAEGISIGFMDRLVRELNIRTILYHEDIADTIITGTYVSVDLPIVTTKLASFGATLETGTAIHAASHQAVTIYKTEYRFPPCMDYPLIRTVTSHTYGFEEVDKKWHQVQMAVGKAFLEHYETLVQVLHDKPRGERTDILMNTFPTIKTKDHKMLQAIIDEMPLAYGRDALAAWLRRASYPTKYPFLDAQVHKKRSEWIFSQVAVEKVAPDLYDILHPSKAPRPSRTAAPLLENQEERPLKPSDLSAANRNPPSFMPTEFASLPSKWGQIKQQNVWSTFKMGTPAEYDRDFPVKMLQWVANELMVPLAMKEWQWVRNKVVIQALLNVDVMGVYMQDPSMFAHWSVSFGRKFPDANQLMAKAYAPKATKENLSQLAQQWVDIYSKGTLWVSDLDLYAFTKLVPCSIIVIHRGQYGAGTKGRGGIADLGVSSTFYTNEYAHSYVDTHPLIILHKTVNKVKDHAEYAPVVDEQGTFIHKSVEVTPKDVRDLIAYHIENKNNKTK